MRVNCLRASVKLHLSCTVSQSTTGPIQNGLESVVSLNEVVTIFETTLATACAAGRVETCLHPLQVSSVAIHVYPAIQLMQAKVFPMKL